MIYKRDFDHMFGPDALEIDSSAFDALDEERQRLQDSLAKLREIQELQDREEEELRRLNGELDVARRNKMCFDAIGDQRPGESGIAYAARAEASYPGTIDEIWFVLGDISRIPEEGIPIDRRYEQFFEQMGSVGVSEVSGFSDDHVYTRQEAVLLNARLGLLLQEKMGKPDVEEEMLDDVRTRYHDELGVDVQDRTLLQGLFYSEYAFRESVREVVQDYRGTHQIIPEPACEGLGKVPLVPAEGMKP